MDLGLGLGKVGVHVSKAEDCGVDSAGGGF